MRLRAAIMPRDIQNGYRALQASRIRLNDTRIGDVISQLRVIVNGGFARGRRFLFARSSCGLTQRVDEFARWAGDQDFIAQHLRRVGGADPLADWFWPTPNTMQSLESERIMSCALKRPFSSPAWSQRRLLKKSPHLR